jgi:DNA-binding transcriptional LysR family regulator
MHNMNWADLQFVLAVAEKGSLITAAKELGVNHSTVLRRVRGFEEELGAKLFERRSTGHSLSPAGEELVKTARSMREMLIDTSRRIAGEDLRLDGTVRVTTTDTLAVSVLPKVLASFSQEHPGVRVDLSTTNQMLSLSRRDAEVAIRPSKQAAASYVGRRVSELAIALYASASYLDRIPARSDLETHVWLGLDESLAGTTIGRWMTKELPNARVVFRVDSVTALFYAAMSGMGVAALPCYLGDTTKSLRRVRSTPIDEMRTELWVLTHEDLKRTARIRTFTEWISKGLAKDADLLEGRRPIR